jgi:hypothetical protein
MAKANPTPFLPFPSTIDRRHFGAWLAGFSDGEGSFVLARAANSGPMGCQFWARYSIRLRADDRPTLELIRSFWGCGFIVRWAQTKKRPVSSNPAVTYSITRVADLFRVVVPHFQQFPLQAKKQRDFVIWEKGVSLLYRIWSRRRPSFGRRKGGDYLGFGRKWTTEEAAEFMALRAALKAQRVYDAGVAPTPPPSPPRPEPRSLFDDLP